MRENDGGAPGWGGGWGGVGSAADQRESLHGWKREKEKLKNDLDKSSRGPEPLRETFPAAAAAMSQRLPP